MSVILGIIHQQESGVRYLGGAEMLQKRFVLTVSLIAMFAVGMAHADIASVEYVEKGLSTKQETISDLSSIRSGAKAGNTAVQPGSLAAVATSGSYNDLSNKPTIPTVNNATLTIQRNGTDVGTFTANASGNKTINITDNDTVYTLPTASSSTKGGVKIGSNVNVSSDGTISVASGTPSQLGVVKVGTIPSGSATSTTYATIWVE